MPSKQDAKEYQKWAVAYMMMFLIEQFLALSHCAKFIPERQLVNLDLFAKCFLLAFYSETVFDLETVLTTTVGSMVLTSVTSYLRY